MESVKLRPFIPSGSDYDLAQRFYSDLGFKTNYANAGLTIYQMGEQEFYLQNFHHQELQNNFMVELIVTDLDYWWQHIQQNIKPKKYPIKVKEPAHYPWGKREIHLIDPAGVCWHISEKNK